MWGILVWEIGWAVKWWPKWLKALVTQRWCRQCGAWDRALDGDTCWPCRCNEDAAWDAYMQGEFGE